MTKETLDIVLRISSQYDHCFQTKAAIFVLAAPLHSEQLRVEMLYLTLIGYHKPRDFFKKKNAIYFSTV